MDPKTTTLILTTSGYVLVVLLNIVALLIVPRNRKPSSGTAWLLVIFLLPFLGWILFLILGSNKLPKSRRDVQSSVNAIVDKEYSAIKKVTTLRQVVGVPVPKKYQAVAQLTESLGRLPVIDKSSIQPITDYNETIEQIVKDIARAKHVVYIGYYILTLDDTTEPLFAALEAALERGVEVKVLYDAFGSRGFDGYKPMKKRLDAAGIRHYPILPLRLPGKNYTRPDLRNHRKIVVIDQNIGYTGSQNLVTRNYHRKDDIVYDELVVRLVGPIVYELNAIFLADWHAESGDPLKTFRSKLIPSKIKGSSSALMQMLPSGPGYPDENNLKVFVQLLYEAERSILIVNPYFVPPEPLMAAIVSAARRGVKIQMVNSEAKDQWMVAHAQRSYYEQLLKAGVDIYLYKKPTLLHSKCMVIDEEVAVIGSSNMDFRSFELISELSLICYDIKIAKQISKIGETYIAHSNQLALHKWQERSRFKRIVDNLARLSSSLQ